jgi:hypothetical protein
VVFRVEAAIAQTMMPPTTTTVCIVILSPS